MKATEVVDNLLEAESDDAPDPVLSDFKAQLAAGFDVKDDADLARFKECAWAYLKWAYEGAQEDAIDPAELVKLEQVDTTWDEAIAILSRYESEPKFMEMTAQGYFI